LNTMKNPNASLITKLTLVVLVKLVLLAGLWWAFFHEQRVTVDAKLVSDQFLSSSRASDNNGEPP